MDLPPFDQLRLCDRPAVFFFTAAPGWTWTHQVGDYHNLWIACSGRGRLHSLGRSMQLEAGSACLLVPGQRVELEHDRLQPMSNFSAHIRLGDWSGPGVLNQLMHQVHRIQALAMAAVEAAQHHDAAGDLQARHLIYVLLCQLQREARGDGREQRHAHARAIADIASRMRLEPQQAWSIEGLATGLGLSRSQLNRCFRRDLGCSPAQFLTRCRIERAVQLLLESDLPIGDIAESCGYSDLFYFSRHFKQQQGASPSAFRKRAQTRSR